MTKYNFSSLKGKANNVTIFFLNIQHCNINRLTNALKN